MNLVGDETFRWFSTFFVGGVSVVWFFYDAFNLWRARTADRKDPLVRDRHFGYVMGLVIATIGVIGSLRFQGVI